MQRDLHHGLLVVRLTMTQQQEPARRDRSAIDTVFTWSVDDLCPSLDAWRRTGEEMRARVSGLEPFRGRLLSSPAVLADALALRFDLDRAVSRLYVYASCLADQDTRVAANQGMQQQMMQRLHTHNPTFRTCPRIRFKDASTIFKKLLLKWKKTQKINPNNMKPF